ncbi:hypothetical protein [Marinicellulosiphila megalodicopiae]|uniref:hypothetical protein n=1 Tax=Marinicellulosiphila megalodicopiae TaxID=2724896 RepID=UPI003BB10C78
MSGIDSAFAHLKFYTLYIQPNNMSMSYFEPNAHTEATQQLLEVSIPFVKLINAWLTTQNIELTCDTQPECLTQIDLTECIQTLSQDIQLGGQFKINLKSQTPIDAEQTNSLAVDLCTYIQNNYSKLIQSDGGYYQLNDYYVKPKAVSKQFNSFNMTTISYWISTDLKEAWNLQVQQNIERSSEFISTIINQLKERLSIKICAQMDETLTSVEQKDWLSFDCYFENINVSGYFNEISDYFWQDFRELIAHKINQGAYDNHIIQSLPQTTIDYFKNNKDQIILSPKQRIELRSNLVMLKQNFSDTFKPFDIEANFNINTDIEYMEYLQYFIKFSDHINNMTAFDTEFGNKLKTHNVKSISLMPLTTLSSLAHPFTMRASYEIQINQSTYSTSPIDFHNDLEQGLFEHFKTSVEKWIDIEKVKSIH